MNNASKDFNSAYYKKEIRNYDYGDVQSSEVNFGLGKYNAKSMRRHFICHSNGDKFSQSLDSGKKGIVTTGFGMSGKPHLGTISQIIKICDLNRHGINTQVVLGDLDTHNSRNQPFEEARAYAESFDNFIRSIGYVPSTNNILRDQYSYPEITRTAYLISKHITDLDFEEAEEDNAEAYENAGIYNGWSFPMKQALALMIADFVYLHQNDGYNHVMVMLGFEEHKYVDMATKVIKRMDLDLDISGVYSRVIKGLSGFPKMSKSLAGSAIDVSTPLPEIYKLLQSENRITEDPRENSTFLIMEQVSFFSNDKMREIEEVYHCGSDDAWADVISAYIDNQLTPILKCWPNQNGFTQKYRQPTP